MSAGTGFGKPTTTSRCICWIWVVHQNFTRRCLWRAEISQNVGTLGTKISGETAKNICFEDSLPHPQQFKDANSPWNPRR
jgi:hypothetical protein